MKKAAPVEAAQNTNFNTSPHEVGNRRPLFQVFLTRPAASAYVIAFIVATVLITYVDRQIALRRIGRAP